MLCAVALVESGSEEVFGLSMSDIQDFLNAYQEVLDNEVREADWPSEILDAYSFESCLKHDNNKEVYLVRDKRTGTKVVLRVMPKGVYNQASAEWAILSKLDHPGIPKTYGLFEDGDNSYVAREFIEGLPLDDVVRQRLMTPQEISSIARMMCDLLGYQHRQTPPVIHRDIKPQNIILRSDGTIVLTDYGIARTYKPEAESDTHYMGTLPYASPEQYGYAQSSPQSDIYALGIVLIYLATGSPNRHNLDERIADKRLLALINHCIAFDSKDRFTSAEEVRFFIDKGKRFKSASKRSSRKGKALRIAVAGLILVFVATGVLLFPDPLGWVVALVGGSNVQDTQNQEQGASTGPADSLNPSDNTDGSSNLLVFEQPFFDSSVSGNTTGNLSNGGFVVEGENEVYVAVTGGIYVLENDGSLGRKVVAAEDSQALNFYRGSLYFYSADLGGLMRANPESGESAVLVDDTVAEIFFDNNTLYYSINYGTELCAIDMDSEDKRVVYEYSHRYALQSISGGYQYFIGAIDENKPLDSSLLRSNLVTGEVKQINNYSGFCLSIYDAQLYFCTFKDVMRTDLDGKKAQALIEGSINYINATPLGLFIANSHARLLEVMSYDSTSRLTLIERECGQLFVTRNWIIYANEEDRGNLWALSMDGTIDQCLVAPRHTGDV